MILTRQHIVFKIIPALIISLLFVTPFMVSDKIYNGVIMAKEFWFFGVVALMLFYSAIQLIIKNGKLRIELNIIDILLLAFYTWCFIRAIFTPYTPFYYNHKLQVLTGMMVVYFFVKNAIRNENNERNEANENNEDRKYSFIPSFLHSFINRPSFILSFLIFSFILSGFLQAIYGLLQLYGVYPSYHNLFKITGSFFNPAPYAMYLAVVFPVALGKALFNEENEKNESNEKNKGNKYSFIFSFIHSFICKYLPIATIIAILLVLPATMNRASWLGATVGSLVVLQHKYDWLAQLKRWLNTHTKKIIAITGTIIVIVGISLSLFYLKSGSSNGRLFIWEVTLGKIAEKPLLGHGLGRFEAEYNNWQAEYFQNHPTLIYGLKGWVAGNTQYGFNEYIEILSEVGIIGLTIFLLMNLSLFLRQRKLETVQKIYSSLFSILVCAFISIPFYSLAVYLYYFILIGITSGDNQKEVVFLVRPNFLKFSVCLSLLISGFFELSYLTRYPYYKYWHDASYNINKGFYYEGLIDYKKSIPAFSNNGKFLQELGVCYHYMHRNQLAVKYLEKAKILTSDQVLYLTLGNSLYSLGNIKGAEANYKFASYMQPNKLLPYYSLAKLYYETGQIKLAKDKSLEIFKIKTKAESLTSKKIKKEAKDILKN